MLNTVISGAAFGAALVTSGVYQPSVIVGQLRLENWHMIQAFLTAAASSALFVNFMDKTGYTDNKPRSATTLNLFSRFDANIIGGALLGVGMGLSGACPGTVLAQVAVGVKSGYYALDGAVLGGIFWTGILRPLLKPYSPKPEVEGEKDALTVHERFSISKATMFVSFEFLCAAAVAATVIFAGTSPTAKISPIAGGLFIGLSQLWSLVTRKSMLGASTAYEEVANFVWWLARGAGVNSRPKNINNIIFALGIMIGAYALASTDPNFIDPGTVSIPPMLAIAGGFLMIIGARIAGGCASGHGISGMSTFSISSFLTIGSAMTMGFFTALCS